MTARLLPIALCCAVGLPLMAQAPAAHWSYRPIERPALPALDDSGFCREPLDRFVLAAMVAHGLAPAAEADRATFLRRASLDLCGLPPTPEAVAAFIADARDDAYERAVDGLLAQPAFGERWALWWLDLARYADSQGYEKDALRRSMWRWRDWVVDAFQRDLPFDQFTIEQLAGDLLPGATIEQHVATAFHRQTMTNTEGGTDDEEFRTAAVIDRTNTTMSVWMGSTVGCAQCHDHKYDPISQREYYRLYAFFDQTADADRPDEEPTLAAPTVPQQQRAAAVDAEIAQVQARIDGADDARAGWLAAQRAAVAAFDAAAPSPGTWRLLGPIAGDSFAAVYRAELAPERGVQTDAEQEGLRWQERADLVDGAVHEWRGDTSAFYLHRTIDAAAAGPAALALGSDDALKVWWNGALVHAEEVSRPAAPDQALVAVELRAGRNELLLKVVNGGGPGGFYFELRPLPFAANVVAALRSPGGDGAQVRAAFAAQAPAVAGERERLAVLQAERAELAGPRVPVLRELPADARRTTRLFLRGSFLTPGEVVTPDVPACWPPLPEGAPRDRLTLARWLVDPANPLTARVQVNRVWEQLFGRGLVATGEDFGVQGEAPSHAELLDWLARDFVDEGWSLKRLLRHIVLSATYRQSSAVPPDQRERDPDNRWLARGAAFRLPGEVLRDQALAVAGLLSARRGGPSVMPEQPAGVWGQIYSGEQWRTSAGEDAHRRSLYTLWRRTSPHPTMTTFDAPSREFCVLRRVRTNTPLQALVLWNDPQFTGCAMALAERVLALPGGDEVDRERLQRLFLWCLLRPPHGDELRRMLEFVRGEREGQAGVDAAARERAVWSRCASVLLCTDAFVTRS